VSEPKLMVAITTHGAYKEFLVEAVNSAMRFADMVSVYDDGGECGDVELSPAALLYGVHYVPLPKTAMCTAGRIEAIRDAIELGADYLLHLDGDDFLVRRPPTLEGVDIYANDYYDVDRSGAIMRIQTYPRAHQTAQEVIESLKCTVGTESPRTPFSLKFVTRVGFLRDHDLSWYEWPSTVYAEDNRTMLEYLKNNPVLVVDRADPFYAYRQHTEGRGFGCGNIPYYNEKPLFHRDFDELVGGGFFES
jgi:hypothetical protein